LYQLNPQQQQAVRYLDGPLLVLAGAGSGKTGVITHKIAWLIRECGIPPRRIAAVTFTNKAAREMKGRVGRMLGGKETRGLTISTFHTLGLNMIRRELEVLGYKKGFSIFDSQDAQGLVRELMRSDLSLDKGLIDQVHYQISRWKNALVSPEQAPAQCENNPVQLAAARVYAAYNRQLKAYNAVDLDDLIVQPASMLREHASVREAWQSRLRYLLVDEYQDTNAAQYELVRLLVGVRGALTVVGDDDQSIYAWRGARPENLARLKDDFPGLKVVKLEQNYRSCGRILKVANALIANNPHNFEKRLWSELGYGEPVQVLKARNDEHEAERVVSALLHHRFQQRSRYRDYAILYRGNHQSRLFERVLREQRIPYYISGEISFFERSEVKDVMAYLRLVANPDDDNAFLRIVNTPRRGIGPATLEKLARRAGEAGVSLLDAALQDDADAGRQLGAVRGFARWVVTVGERAEQEPALDVVRQLLSDIQYEDWIRETCGDEAAAERRLGNVRELLDWLQRLGRQGDGERGLAELVADLTLMDILDREDKENADDRVSLMTLHAAKGLEFPHVFIIGLEEQLLPHRSSIEEDSLEEERRLFYVGITRAQRTLTLTLAGKRRRFGETLDCEPSRFLEELPADDLQWDGGDADLSPEQKRERAQAHLANMRAILGTG
jgi:ATP-dependent DNA helicase Rep